MTEMDALLASAKKSRSNSTELIIRNVPRGAGTREEFTAIIRHVTT